MDGFERDQVEIFLSGTAAYYVTGNKGGFGIGRLARNQADAETLCQLYYASGFRNLEIFNRASRNARPWPMTAASSIEARRRK